ncbi:MAG TPA: signal recognition particle-docking protein FtsY [Pseudomonadales bacterium]|nr:signal recognition particle-docking protein FtsY [Pseudomonadales bacterium]
MGQNDENTERGFLRRLRGGLAKTRTQLGNLFLGKKAIDDDVLAELETSLLRADVGVEATQRIMDALAQRVKRKQLADTDALFEALRAELVEQLRPIARPLVIDPARRPFVILVVGVNGAGKTTTIGKLGQRLKAEGKSVLLAAGDTFRAAAVEQLTSWGHRHDIPVIAQQQGSDSASVVFDAVRSGQARDADVVIADTAGRLQAKTNLMEELAKIKRVVSKLDSGAPHSVLLVLDGSVGQNALSQVKEFDTAVGLTGLIVTKLDGTAKAGVLFAIANTSRFPVHFVGIGEAVEDLRPFEPEAFVDALLARGAD